MLNLLIGPIAGLASNILKRVLPEKVSEEDRLRIEAAFATEMMKADWSVIEKKADIIIAEAQSKSWLARSWRPITMLVFVYIIAHNYIIAPLLAMFIDSMPILEIPPDMWDLLKLGIGGYIAGRSAEKFAKEWKK